MIYIGWNIAINPQQIAEVEQGEIPIDNEFFVELKLSNGAKHLRRFSTKKEAAGCFRETIAQITRR